MADQHQKPLAGKVALVTGGAKRLGKAAGLALAKAGADVAITFLESAKEAQQTAKQIENLGVRALAVPCDVTDPKSVRSAIAERALTSAAARTPLHVTSAQEYPRLRGAAALIAAPTYAAPQVA